MKINDVVEGIIIESLASDPVTQLNKGRIYFNSTTNSLKKYDGTAWRVITDDYSIQSLFNKTLVSPSLTTPTTNNLAIDGLAGQGYVSLAEQISNPSAVVGKVFLFSKSDHNFYVLDQGGVEKKVITSLNGAASVGSLSITGTAGAGYEEMATQSASPSAPSAGNVRVYSKTDNKLYIKDSSGVETEIGSGGGGGSGAMDVDVTYKKHGFVVGDVLYAANVSGEKLFADGSDGLSTYSLSSTTSKLGFRYFPGNDCKVSSVKVRVHTSGSAPSATFRLAIYQDNASSGLPSSLILVMASTNIISFTTFGAANNASNYQTFSFNNASLLSSSASYVFLLEPVVSTGLSGTNWVGWYARNSGAEANPRQYYIKFDGSTWAANVNITMYSEIVGSGLVFEKAFADSPSNSDVVGIVKSVTDTNNFNIAVSGPFGLLTAGKFAEGVLPSSGRPVFLSKKYSYGPVTNWYLFGAGGMNHALNSLSLFGQTFTSPSVPSLLTSIRLELVANFNSEWDEIYITLHETSGGLPSGQIGQTASIMKPDLPDIQMGIYQQFDFVVPVKLNANTVYAFCVNMMIMSSNFSQPFAYSEAGFYTGGDLIESSDGGMSWNIVSGRDLINWGLVYGTRNLSGILSSSKPSTVGNMVAPVGTMSASDGLLLDVKTPLPVYGTVSVSSFTPPTPVTGGTLQTIGSLTLNKGVYLVYGQVMLSIGSGTMGADPYLACGVSVGTATEQAPYMCFVAYSGSAGSGRVASCTRTVEVTQDGTIVYLVSRNGLSAVSGTGYSIPYLRLEATLIGVK